jgi:hypothetical protein
LRCAKLIRTPILIIIKKTLFHVDKLILNIHFTATQISCYAREIGCVGSYSK